MSSPSPLPPTSTEPDLTPNLRRYHVSVVEEARIVERGERRRKWFVRARHDWVRVGDHASAVLEETDDDSARCPPGIVWQRRFELVLPRGTRLMALSTFPRVQPRSTLWYLNHGASRAELVYQQRQYRVVGNYRLVELGEMQQRLGDGR